MLKLADILKEVKTGEIEEINLKKAIGTAALAAGLAGTPQAVKAQTPTPTTIQQKDTATTGFGVGKSINEATARKIAYMNALADLLKKLGKTEVTSGIEVVDEHTYMNGKMYEVEIKVKLAEKVQEGIDDPVKPGILKKRLGNLSCSRVRSAKSKLKDKGTHYAKALQRYLNYHC